MSKSAHEEQMPAIFVSWRLVAGHVDYGGEEADLNSRALRFEDCLFDGADNQGSVALARDRELLPLAPPRRPPQVVNLQ